jgi:hypothetical protein
LAIILAERYCREILGYPEDRLATLYPAEVMVRAGSEPSQLFHLPVSISLEESRSDETPLTSLLFNAAVGNLKVKLRIISVSSNSETKANKSHAVGSLGDVVKARSAIIEDIVVQDGKKIAATARFAATPGHSPDYRWLGMASSLTSRLHLPEALVIAGQLGQTIVYAHDKIARAESENLWMRRIEICLNTSGSLTVDNPVKILGGIDSARDIRVGDKTFRTFHVSGLSDHFNCKADIAHALPAGVPASDEMVAGAL